LIVNSYFKKKDEHLVTFKSGSTRTQIDYFLLRANSRRMGKDCKVIPSECLTMQHKLLVTNMVIRSPKRRKKTTRDFRVKWWNLTGENVTKLSLQVKPEGTWGIEEDANKMWEAMADCIRRSAK